jgi:transposase-like protein
MMTLTRREYGKDRNRYRQKPVIPDVGELPLAIPRDRQGDLIRS